MFSVFDDDANRQWKAGLRDRVRGHPERYLGGADALLQEGLHEALIWRSRTVLRRSLAPPVRFLVHRMLASAYVAMQRRLSLASIGYPEAHWAAARSRLHVEAAYRALCGSASRVEERV
jgi:hypothetical protein